MKSIELLLLFIFLSLFSETYSQEDTSHTAIIYGNDNSFVVKAPKGWILDTKSGLSSGLTAVFYPLGSSWEKGTTVMYCNSASKKVKGNETLQQIMDFDIGRFKNEQGAEISEGGKVITSDSNVAIIKNFYNKKNKNFEAVAYIDESNVVVFLVISSRDKDDFEKSFESFNEFVKSYYYLTDNVKIEDKK